MKPKKGSVRKMGRTWDRIRNGYVPIYPVGFDVNGAVGKRSNSVMGALELLHVPYSNFKTALVPKNIEAIQPCTKLDFLVNLLSEVKKSNRPMRIAIVGSTIKREKLFTAALKAINLPYSYVLSRVLNQERIKTSLYGVLVEYPYANKWEEVTNTITADYVIVYDSSLIPERDSVFDHFKTASQEIPGKLSLATLYSPDIRICNYRDAHPQTFKNPNEKVKNLSDYEMHLATNSSFEKLPKNERKRQNERMLQRVKTWMLLKDNTVFEPFDPFEPFEYFKPSGKQSTEPFIVGFVRNDPNSVNTSNIATASSSMNTTSTQKRSLSDTGYKHAKKQRTDNHQPTHARSTDDINMSDNLNESENESEYNSDNSIEYMKTGGIEDPIEILSSDSSRSSSPSSNYDSAPSSPVPIKTEIEMPSESSLPPLPPPPLSSTHNHSESTIETFQNSKSDDQVESETSANDIKGLSNTDEVIKDDAKDVSEESKKDHTTTKEVYMVQEGKSAMTDDDNMTQSLKKFEIELEKIHAEFVQRITQNS